jgi:glycosyltransferase involved in cell wall biosynthesis
MKNVLYIASRADIAGGEVYLLDVFRHLDPARFRPTVVVPGDGPLARELISRGIECQVLSVNYDWLKPPTPWYLFLEGLSARVRDLATEIARRRIDLVHTNSNQIVEGALAAQLAGKHHIHVAHLPYQQNLPIYERLGLDPASFAEMMGALSTRIVAVAEPVARSLSPPVPRSKIRVIRNGIDLDAYRGARERADGSFRAELGIPASAPLVAGVGRLHPDKGFEYLVDAATAVFTEVPGARFVVAGVSDDVDYERGLRQRIDAAGLGEQFHLLGHRTDVPRILAEANVFALTSRIEGGPYALIEAVASGCACVASRCGGFVAEVIAPGRTGCLVDYGDAAGTAAALVELLGQPRLREQIASAAREVVFKGGFDVRESVAKLEAVYDEALSEPAPAPGSYPIDLLLQASSEVGRLGEEVLALEQRLTRAERAADLLLENPAVRLLRRAMGRRSR